MSNANPVVKRMRALTRRKRRKEEAATVVYGVQPVTHAVEAGFPVEVIVYVPALLQRSGALRMVQRQREAGVRVVAVDAELMGRLSGRDGPGGLAAIVGTRVLEPSHIPLPAESTLVALDRVSNPGNLGTILRTVDSVQGAGLVLIGDTADPFDPSAVKASMGAVFRVPIARLDTVDSFLGWAESRELPVVTTSAKAREMLWATPLPPRVAILMGSEGDGLADMDLRRGTIQLSIPMAGSTESLNLAVATGVLLYEAWRQRSGLSPTQ